MKTYTFTTFDATGNEVDTYKIETLNLQMAKDYAKKKVALSRDNEVRHGRITLA
jgi:hypothetical protein